MVEMAWKRMQEYSSVPVPIELPPIDRRELQKLLPVPDQWVRLHW